MPDNAPTQAEVQAWLELAERWDRTSVFAPLYIEYLQIAAKELPRIARSFLERTELLERAHSPLVCPDCQRNVFCEAAEAIRKWRTK
jgi:hypothetical protein